MYVPKWLFGMLAGWAGGNGAKYGLSKSYKITSVNNYGIVLKQTLSKSYINQTVGRELIKGTVKSSLTSLFLNTTGQVNVVDLQKFLGVEADGIIGENTTLGIKALQGILGVEQDGIYGPQTEAALKKAIVANN